MISATVSASASPGCGGSLAGLLTIAFIVLKLTHVIAWSWVWVLVLVGVAAVAGIGALLNRSR